MNATTPFRYPTALTIAGSDSGGGAGIQADLKTFSAVGVYGLSALTAVTAQNTQGIRHSEAVGPSLLSDQLEALFDDFTIDAVKIGMLPTAEAVHIVAGMLDRHPALPVVLDPVLASTSGSKLIDDEAVHRMRKELFPRISLLTPNTVEAGFLTGTAVETEEDRRAAGLRLLDEGCRAVLIKGGHFAGNEKTDVLFQAGQGPLRFQSPAVATRNMHGTGCTLSSAIAAYLALKHPLAEAVARAKVYMTEALAAGKEVKMGKGAGPVNHFFAPVALKKILADA